MAFFTKESLLVTYAYLYLVMEKHGMLESQGGEALEMISSKDRSSKNRSQAGQSMAGQSSGQGKQASQVKRQGKSSGITVITSKKSGDASEKPPHVKISPGISTASGESAPSLEELKKQGSQNVFDASAVVFSGPPGINGRAKAEEFGEVKLGALSAAEWNKPVVASGDEVTLRKVLRKIEKLKLPGSYSSDRVTLSALLSVEGDRGLCVDKLKDELTENSASDAFGGIISDAQFRDMVRKVYGADPTNGNKILENKNVTAAFHHKMSIWDCLTSLEGVADKQPGIFLENHALLQTSDTHSEHHKQTDVDRILDPSDKEKEKRKDKLAAEAKVREEQGQNAIRLQKAVLGRIMETRDACKKASGEGYKILPGMLRQLLRVPERKNICTNAAPADKGLDILLFREMQAGYAKTFASVKGKPLIFAGFQSFTEPEAVKQQGLGSSVSGAGSNTAASVPLVRSWKCCDCGFSRSVRGEKKLFDHVAPNDKSTARTSVGDHAFVCRDVGFICSEASAETKDTDQFYLDWYSERADKRTQDKRKNMAKSFARGRRATSTLKEDISKVREIFEEAGATIKGKITKTFSAPASRGPQRTPNAGRRKRASASICPPSHSKMHQRGKIVVWKNGEIQQHDQ